MRNTGGSEEAPVEEYSGRFLVVASGETSDVFVPEVKGLDSFGGEVIHSTKYKCGEKYSGKRALVVGSGNSGMEIALDLSLHGAETSIVIRSPVRYTNHYDCLKNLKSAVLHMYVTTNHNSLIYLSVL